MRNFSISIILVLIVLKDYQTSALSLNCVQCENCPEEITDFSNSEPCETQCAVYKNENNQIDRGCFVSAENIMLVCPGDNCNYKRIPTCDQCTTLDDCITTVCDRENDECYAGKFDERRGCTSDSVYDSTSADFETCSTNRCNRVVQCVKCDSNEATHSNCLDEPETFIAPCEKHGTIKEDNCYRHVDGEQFQLGCISDTNFPPTCGDQGYPCRKCEDDNCNAKDFQTCYVCSDNTNCADVQTNQNTLICAEYNSECFMAYTYSTKMIERGCLEDLPDTFYEDITVTCATPNCNQEEFPDKSTHLKCYQDTLGEVEYCKSPDATKCFTLEDESGNSLRGCNTDDGFAELCREGDNCVVCDTSECNSPTECVICSGSESCRDEPLKRACAESKLSNECYTYLDKANLEKGCLGELMNGDTTSNVYEACSSDNSLCNKCFGPHCNEVHCLKCDSAEDDTCVEGDPDSIAFEACLPDDRCLMFKDEQGYTKRGCSSNFDGSDEEGTDPGYNFGLVPSDAIKCYQCTEDCVDTDESQLKYCSSNSVLGCYYIFDGVSITSRGCLSEEGLDCDGDQYCNSCTGTDGCNSNTIIECYHCSFDEATQDCITSGSTETCSTTGDCVVYIDNEGKFVRGCESDLPTEATCAKTCSDNMCNKNDVCDASIDCYGICSAVMPEEKCVRYQNVNQVHTGCNEFREEICDLDDEHCYVCDQNLCNRAAVAECYDCTNCPIIEPQHRTILCENINDNCYTATENPSGQVIRGCFSDKKDELTGLETCVGAACNKAPLVEGNSCYQCTDCSTTDGRTPTSCGNPRFEGCYTAQDLTERTISRGCKTDADYSEKCQKFNCLECVGEDCNTDQVRPQPLWCSSCFEADCFDYTAPKPCKEGMLVDYCIEYVVFNIPIYKGCLSDGIPPEIESDCNGDERFCKLCDKNYCNTPNLSCYECTSLQGFDCITKPDILGNTKECGGLAHCYTSVDKETGVLSRGCSTEGTAECIEGPLCKNCQDHNCNVDVVPNDRLYCYQCEGLNCLNPTNSEPCQIYEADQKCFTYAEDAITVYRGCSNDNFARQCDEKPCVFCPGRGCNDEPTIVPNTLSCIQCIRNSDCDGKAFGEKCTKDLLLGRSDSCYTQYHSTAVPIEKGCLSDLTESHPCMQGSLNCNICSGDDCNRGKAICYECDSEQDNDCSQISNETFTSECTGECVTLVDDYTKRGCIEDFPELEVVNCENSEYCEICQGKQCNSGILPDTRTQCYVCEGSECVEPSAELLKACTRYREDDHCYTNVVNASWVQRDCWSSLENENCGDYCQSCVVPGCNNQGVMQPNTLTCIKCEDGECVGKVDGSKCTSPIMLGRQDWCYTFESKGKLSKGCLSDLEENESIKDACTNDVDELCVVCSNDNCNGDFPYCITCDSENDASCGGYLAKVPDSMRTLCEERNCITYVDENGYTRKGCADETNFCEDKEHCVECAEPMCNNAAFPEGRILCHQCENCGLDRPIGAPLTCRQYDASDSCYVDVTDLPINRGCVSDAQVTCDPDSCLTCTTNGCNDQPYEYESSLSCIQCMGARDCESASVPSACDGLTILGQADECFSLEVNGEVIQKGCRRTFDVDCEEPDCNTCSCNGCNFANKKDITCAKCSGNDCGNAIPGGSTCLGTGCISYVSRDGIVSRGCLEDFQNECSSFGSKHKTCFADNCNINIFPEDRILCHRCENCLENIGSPEICPTYVENDNCYTAQSVDGQSVSRGCQSELLTNCVEPLCSLCDESGCNSRNPLDPGTTETPEITPTSTVTNEITTTLSNEVSTTPAPTFLSCLRCQESSDDASCAWGFQTSAAEQCSSEHATGCFTCQKDSLTIRGCSSEDAQSSCTLEPETCREDGCNNKNHRTQRCADGTGSSYTVKDCEGIVEYDKRGCYILRSGLGVVVNRGCYAKLTEEQIQTCSTDRNICYICTEDGCNSGFMVRVLNSLIVIVVVLGLARNITL
ncbi:extracellular matrix protein A isoform X2 [Aedes aegypti]|uniref:DUF753 domain-containing protein n=1 Tax=Aedes aegypti TaxID=7159 RepID=A0A6I8TCU8_AEDAE|nr:extracellular matrix protein A isoform X2 [Aedes aegypti]